MIDRFIHIPGKELRFVFARAGGSGGQHVNKVNTKVTLLFDVISSQSLTLEQKQRIKSRLPGRVNRAGVLRVTSTRYRSQKANRDDAIERFAHLISFALKEKKNRKKTRISVSSREKRFQTKRHRSTVKQLRKKVQME